jgi:tRNA A37 methylthiotransferase MiaB
LSIIEEVDFARVHAFAFSPREGTKAYTMPDVPAEIKSIRLHKLLQAGECAAKKYIDKRLNSIQSVIFEDYDGQFTGGYTAGYIKVYVEGEHKGRADVKLISHFKDGTLAQLI